MLWLIMVVRILQVFEIKSLDLTCSREEHQAYKPRKKLKHGQFQVCTSTYCCAQCICDRPIA